VDECLLLVLLLYEGKSIIHSVGIFFNVDSTAGSLPSNIVVQV